MASHGRFQILQEVDASAVLHNGELFTMFAFYSPLWS
jgi:hypothetical protein